MGDESTTDSGESSTTISTPGGAFLVEGVRRGRTSVAAESTVEAFVTSEPSIFDPPSGCLDEGAARKTKVAWLDALEIFDLDSCLEVDLESMELCGDSPTSSFRDIDVPDVFL